MITKIYHDEDDNIYDHDEDYDVNDDLVVKASSSILAPVVSSCSARTRIKPVPYFLCSFLFFLESLLCYTKSHNVTLAGIGWDWTTEMNCRSKLVLKLFFATSLACTFFFLLQ